MLCPVPTASISTVAPIWAIPDESVTEPEIEPGVTPAIALAHTAATTTNHVRTRAISTLPNKGLLGIPQLPAKDANPCKHDPYSTAKRTEGVICCFETLSSTLTVRGSNPGSKPVRATLFSRSM